MMNRQEFYGSEEFKNFISRSKESGMNFVPDGEQVFRPGEDQDINYDEVYNRPFISFSETVADKSHHDFLEILEKDSNDFLTYLHSRFPDPSQCLYSDIISELVLFTTLRYHEDKADNYISQAHKGASKMAMHIAWVKYEYEKVFPKKGKGKKK
jgi:hypothetical protein